MVVDYIDTSILIKNISKRICFYKSYIIGKRQFSKDALDAYCLFERMELLDVSVESKFSDKTWDLISLETEATGDKSNYRISWENYSSIPQIILIKIKLLAFNSIINRAFLSNKNSELAIITITSKIQTLLGFFNRCFDVFENKFGKGFTESSLENLSELPNGLVSDVAKNYHIDKGRIVQAFKSFEQKKVLDLLQENKQIVYSKLDFPGVREENKKTNDKVKFIPKNDFTLLTRKATFEIVAFLKVMGSSVNCQQSLRFYEFQVDNNQSYKIPYSRKLHEVGVDTFFYHWAYSRNKGSVVEKNTISMESSSSSRTILIEKGVIGAELKRHHEHILASALFIIGAYTGMRPSELLAINYSKPLKKVKELYRIKTRILKRRERTSLFNDEYLAIPIVLDAFNCLVELRKLYRIKHHYAFQIQNEAQPISMKALKKIMTRYLNNVLEEDKGTNMFYPYLFRHNLAYQLYRAELGLPYISYALKHLVTSLDVYKSFSDVTLGYGGIGDQIAGGFSTAETLKKEAGMENIRMTLDPDGKYAGRGSKNHKIRLEGAFKPYLVAGYSKDQVFEMMYEQGYFLVNVGLTYCMASDATEDFNNELPCVGGLRCNPHDCSQAVISQEHKSKWKEINVDALSNIKELKSAGSEFSSKLKQLEEVASISSKVLCDLERLDG